MLFEEWAGSNESWKKSNLILQMTTRESRKVRGGRRWLTEREISAKYNSPEIASDIIKAKLENEVLRQTSVRCHPDLPDKPEMNQYLIWDFGVETDERDEILESLFNMEDGSDSEGEAEDSSNKKNAKKNKKKSKTDGKSKKKKKRRSSFSSSSAPSSLKSTSSSESTKKKRKNEKKKKNKKHGKNKKSSEDDSGSEASVPKLTDAQKRKAEREQAKKDEQERKRLAKEEEKERKDKEKEEKKEKERQEKEAKREAEKDKERKRNLVKKEPLVWSDFGACKYKPWRNILV